MNETSETQTLNKMKPRLQHLLLLLLPLLCQGLSDEGGGDNKICDRDFQRSYCSAPYGGDMHTACRFCGVGLGGPAHRPSGRGLDGEGGLREEILRRHNAYRAEVRAMSQGAMAGRARCIPKLR